MRVRAWSILAMGAIAWSSGCGGSDSTNLEPSAPGSPGADGTTPAEASAASAGGPANSAVTGATGAVAATPPNASTGSSGGSAGLAPSGSPEPIADASPDGSGSEEVAFYESLAQSVQAEAQRYRASMLAADMTLADCAPLLAAHDAALRPLLAQMLELGGRMDDLLQQRGRAAFADVECSARALSDELDHYAGVACASADLAAIQAAAVQHADATLAYAGHASQRCGQMASGFGDGALGWAPMMAGCAQPAPAPAASDGLGERIFNSGIGVDGNPIPRSTASGSAYSGGMGPGMMGGSSMMGAAGNLAACADCHGSDGRGRFTMMFTSPDIRYSNLTDPAGMREVDGSRGATYTDVQIRRAIVEGIGADGDALNWPMPRWQLSEQDWTELSAYLKALP